MERIIDLVCDHFGATCILIITVAVGVGMGLDSAGCASKSRLMGLEYSWGPLQGCMVRHDGRWDPLEKYIVMREWAR